MYHVCSAGCFSLISLISKMHNMIYIWNQNLYNKVLLLRSICVFICVWLLSPCSRSGYTSLTLSADKLFMCFSQQLNHNQHSFSFAPHFSLCNPTASFNKPLYLPAAYITYFTSVRYFLNDWSNEIIRHL